MTNILGHLPQVGQGVGEAGLHPVEEEDQLLGVTDLHQEGIVLPVLQGPHKVPDLHQFPEALVELRNQEGQLVAIIQDAEAVQRVMQKFRSSHWKRGCPITSNSTPMKRVHLPEIRLTSLSRAKAKPNRGNQEKANPKVANRTNPLQETMNLERVFPQEPKLRYLSL